MKAVLKAIKKPFLLVVFMIIACGVIYPLCVTGLSQLFFQDQANGSLVMIGNQVVGSTLIGQDFTDPRLMKCRPSAVNYNTYTQADKDNGTYTGVQSGSTNYSATNPKLIERMEKDITAFLKANPTIKKEDIPADMMSASGSGLDPHISVAAAKVQLPEIAQQTGLSQERLEDIVNAHTTSKVLGIFGEETVNVLQVNLEIAKAIGMIG